MTPVTDVTATPPMVSGITDRNKYFQVYRLAQPKSVRDVMDKWTHSQWGTPEDPTGVWGYQKALTALSSAYAIDPAVAFANDNMDMFDIVVERLRDGTKSIQAWSGPGVMGGHSPFWIAMPPDLTPAVDPVENEYVGTLYRSVADYKALGFQVNNDVYNAIQPRGWQVMRGVTLVDHDGKTYTCITQIAPDDPITQFMLVG